MAGGPSPNGASPSGLVSSPFPSGSFSSTASSPPKPTYSAQKPKTSDTFAVASGGSSHGYNLSPISQRKPLDNSAGPILSFSQLEPTISNPEMTSFPIVFMRKLPRSTGIEALRSMLLFAKDLIDVEFVDLEHPEDQGFLSAIARFKTLAGAHEARDRLNGKANAAKDANMIVEVLQHGMPVNFGTRRNTIDGASNRHGSSSASSGVSGNGPTNRQSRYNEAFKMSPPTATPGLGNGTFPSSESSTHIQSLFSPQSPIGNSFASSKFMINDDTGDDETGQILQNPLAYATKNGEASQPPLARRSTNPQIPMSRFAGLSISTPTGSNGLASPPLSSFASPHLNGPIPTPGPAMSPHTVSTPMSSLGPNASYQLTPAHYQRHNYPPVNPADQNPPCNTLYVGNLPIDTSEDELKAMFSKQRGYKRLCFRTKQNGPMCFVEFEDVSFATKALNELYGHPLHNSVKGGIRLSFSKNPLGVRTGQSSNMGPSTPMTPQAVMPGMSNGIGAPPGFANPTIPPPGLAAPPGLSPPMSMGGASTFGVFANGGFGMGSVSMAAPMRAPPLAGASYSGMDGAYSGYMMGR